MATTGDDMKLQRYLLIGYDSNATTIPEAIHV
jgi:hypothetical protein